MAIKAPAIVRGRDGLLGSIEHPELLGRLGGGEAVEVTLDDGRALRVPAELLLLQADGSYALALSALEIDRLGASGLRDEEAIVVPVVAEEIAVGKRKVETGRVRVVKTVESTEHEVDEPVSREEVEVERVAINRTIAEPVGPRQEGDTLIVPLLEEVLVVEKRLILREEVRITRRKVEGRSKQTVTLRTEKATVERVEGSGLEDRPA